MDCTAARRTQKADREKLRRGRLNEQFVALVNVLDPDRRKNDKATVIDDTIQLLQDLTSEVSKLKIEYAALNEESCGLARETNDLREENASLKSDIERLNCQYQQQLRIVSPWTAMDHSVMVVSPSYPYPVPMPMPMPMPMPPSPIVMQPYPFYANQHSAIIPNPCSTYVPFLVPNTLVEQQSIQHIAPPLHPGFQSHMSGKQESRNKCKESIVEKHEYSNDVIADQTSGFSADQDLSSGQMKSSCTEVSLLGRCSSSRSFQESSSSSVVRKHKG